MAQATFSWAAATDVGLGLAQGLGRMLTSSAQATVASANAEAQNLVRQAQNQERAARTGLAATVRSINNARRLRAAGDAQRAVTENIIRTQQDFLANNLEAGVRDLEEVGAATARAAAAGVGGGSVRALGETILARQARLAQITEEQYQTETYDMRLARAGIMQDAAAGMDISTDSAGLDYSVSQAPVATGGGWAEVLSGVLDKRQSLSILSSQYAAYASRNKAVEPTIRYTSGNLGSGD